MTVASWSHPVVVAAMVALIVLGAALLRAHAGRAVLRLATLAVAAVVFASVLEPTVPVEATVMPRVRMVATGPVREAVRAELERTVGTRFDLIEASPDRGELAVALHATRAPGESPTQPRLLWSAPIHGGGVPAAPVADAQAFWSVAPLGFDPQDVRLSPVGEGCVGRPLSLVLSGLPRVWSGVVQVFGGDGAVAAETAIETVAPDADLDSRARVELLPTEAGSLAVRIEARADAVRLVATGEVVVGPPPRILAVGPGAALLAGALRAQGFAVEVAETLATLSPECAAVVATRILTDDEQTQLLEYVGAGGGAFLVGSEDGGAVPIDGEPGSALSPVLLAAKPHGPLRDANRSGAESPEAPPPRASEPNVPPAGEAPLPPAHGDTASAKPPVGPEELVDRRTVAMVFLIDRSGSMTAEASPGGPTRMDFVRSSAQATASKLMPGDELAVVTFGNRDADKVLLALTSSTALERVHRALASLEAQSHEGTYVDSALVRAMTLLAGSKASVKHVVVITDGLIEDLAKANQTAALVRERGITVSMIRFGTDVTTLQYTDLCRRFVVMGGGGYLHATTTTEVPALVSAEVKRVLRATGRPYDDEGTGGTPPGEAPVETSTETPAGTTAKQQPDPPPAPEVAATPAAPVRLAVRVLEASPLLQPLPASGPPPVGGVLAVAARPEARVLLVAGDDGRPLLAFKNYGLGRVATWTADLAGPWSAPWRAEGAFPGWLAQWVAALAPPEAAGAAADVLTARVVEPLGPTPAQVAALEAYTGRPLREWRDAEPPAAVAVTTRRPLADLCALAGGLGMLLLAALEFVLARRRSAIA